MGISVVIIGGLIGSIFTAIITQVNYQHRWGAKGILPDSFLAFSFDLGWGSQGLKEVREDMLDLGSRAQKLEEELRALQRERLRRAREFKLDDMMKGLGNGLVGKGGDGIAGGVKQMGRKVLGVGGKVHKRIRPSRHQFMNVLRFKRRGAPEDDLEDGHDVEDEHLDMGSGARSPEEIEWDDELHQRQRELQAELDDVKKQEGELRKMGGGEDVDHPPSRRPESNRFSVHS